jgi:hypothetical protein
MARATPIVATAVGGIPGLLPPDCLVRRSFYRAFRALCANRG